MLRVPKLRSRLWRRAGETPHATASVGVASSGWRRAPMPDAPMPDAPVPWRCVAPKGVRSTEAIADAIRRAFERHMADAGYQVRVTGTFVYWADGAPVCKRCMGREIQAVTNRAAAAACDELGVPRHRRPQHRTGEHCFGCPNA